MIEETTVREKATESIKKVFAMIRIKDFETTIMAMLKRLMLSGIYTSKCAMI